MQYSKTGKQLTERFEGCVLHAYADHGEFSIGYGHRGVPAGSTCTQAQAEAWLDEDIQAAVDFVNKHVTWPLTQGQFDSLVDFTFNVGIGNFLNSTLLRMINAGKFSEAAAQFARWNKAGGHVDADLVERREAEKEEFVGPNSARPDSSPQADPPGNSSDAHG